MKNFISILIYPAIILILSACTTSKSTVSSHVDLSGYQYASIINNETYHIPAELMEYEIQLFDAVEASRLKLVSDYRIHELKSHQQEALLLVKYGISQNENETIVTVNFIDFMTGRPVASCRGAFGLGLSYGQDLKVALKRVTEQIAKTFPAR